MSWAKRRQTFIIGILVLIVFVVAVYFFKPIIYKAPSCIDGIQNRDETGIDCGGNFCTYLCSQQVQNPVIKIQPRPLLSVGGRTDVISYVDNTNPDAAVKNARYTIELYGQNNILVIKKTGTVDLPSHTTVPIFVPNILNGSRAVYGFITFDPTSFRWFKSTTTVPTLPISNIKISNSDTPRITAIISNPTARSMYRVKVIIAVFSAEKNVIAASQTIVPVIPAQGSAPIVFTWSKPFTSTPAEEDVWPIIPLIGP